MGDGEGIRMSDARSTDWKTRPLPRKRTTISLDRMFSKKDMARIRRGVVPRQMEDKWFIYWEGDSLYFHRSWTGFCFYIVRFTEEVAGWRMIEAMVNRNPKQYRETSDEIDRKRIPFLVDVLLLHRNVEFPDDGSLDGDRIISAWSLVGRALLGQHPKDRNIDELAEYLATLEPQQDYVPKNDKERRDLKRVQAQIDATLKELEADEPKDTHHPHSPDNDLSGDDEDN